MTEFRHTEPVLTIGQVGRVIKVTPNIIWTEKKILPYIYLVQRSQTFESGKLTSNPQPLHHLSFVCLF